MAQTCVKKGFACLAFLKNFILYIFISLTYKKKLVLTLY